MGKFKKSSIGAAILAVGTFLSFGGVVASTVAWYAYSTNVTVSMSGTSVNQTEQLQVGIKTDITFPSALVTQFKLEQVNDNGEIYTFAAPGFGLDSSVLNYYLTQSGHASNQLSAITSNGYESGDELNLKDAPIAYKPERDIAASKSQYAQVPLAFRTVRVNDAGEYEYIKKQNIWITDVKCIADNGIGEVYKAVRLHLDGSKLNGSNEKIANKFILNPSAAATSNRETAVAGVLNLDGDDFYDVDANSLMIGGNEIIYGQYDSLPSSSEILTEDSEIDDVNNTGNDNEITTFTAKHKAENNVYTSYAGFTPHKAKFKTLSDIKPSTDSNGFLSGGETVAVTSDSDAAIADLTMTVYVEGWDHTVIDQELSHSFYLGLTFEINRKA